MESRIASGERSLRAHWLGRLAYRPAWSLQQALAAARAAGELDEDQLLLVEHEPVLTLGRNADAVHVLAGADLLAARGIEVVRVERGGEVTYHGPGQLVAYPIVALGMGPGALGVRRFVEALEAAMAAACAAFGVAAGPRPHHPGAWVAATGPLPRKIGALGIRVARGVTFHGIALNITTNLADFELIDPCGTPGLRSTSLALERARARERALGAPGPEGSRASLPGDLVDRPAGLAADHSADGPAGGPAAATADATVDAAEPTTASVAAVAVPFARELAARLGARLAGGLPPAADPAAELAALWALARRAAVYA